MKGSRGLGPHIRGRKFDGREGNTVGRGNKEKKEEEETTPQVQTTSRNIMLTNMDFLTIKSNPFSASPLASSDIHYIVQTHQAHQQEPSFYDRTKSKEHT
jgi:hypothetical protein